MAKKEKFSPSLLDGKASRYISVSNVIRENDTIKKKLSEELKALAEEHGQIDEKGTSTIRTDVHEVQRVARHSTGINTAAAVALFLSKPALAGIVREITAQVVEESDIEQAYLSGKITKDELASIVTDNVSYSVSVKALEK